MERKEMKKDGIIIKTILVGLIAIIFLGTTVETAPAKKAKPKKTKLRKFRNVSGKSNN